MRVETRVLTIVRIVEFVLKVTLSAHDANVDISVLFGVHEIIETLQMRHLSFTLTNAEHKLVHEHHQTHGLLLVVGMQQIKALVKE